MLNPLRHAPWLALVWLVASAATASDAYPVLAVAAADRIVLQYRGLPIALPLAHIEVPEATRSACLERLTALTKGKGAEVYYVASFGADANGAARVQMVVGSTNLNLDLVSKGLARYQPGPKYESAFEEPLKNAQDKAQKSKLGLWGQAAAPVASAAPVAAAPAAVAGTAVRASGPFCSELDTPFYYATGAKEVANVNVQRLIYYPDESTAQRAGKKPRPQAPAPPAAAAASPTDEKSLDSIFAQGKDIYAQAIAKGNTPERDQLYEQAFVVLSKAMQGYSALADQRPDDDALGNKLHECAQLRYGSIKQRRFAE
jgi:hypothetical protein